MTFDEAVELARRVPKVLSGARVVAMGFFVPIDEYQEGMPWRVSIIVPGWVRPRMLSSHADLDAMVPPLPKKPEAAPQRTRNERELQASLFD